MPGVNLWCFCFYTYELKNLIGQKQKFIVKAYPIDGHICTVMNPIQWRDKWRGLWEVPGQRGPIQHVSIVLNTINMTGCRHNSLEVLHFSRGLLPLPHQSLPCCWLQRHPTCFISSNVSGYWDLTGPAGESVFNRLLMFPTCEGFSHYYHQIPPLVLFVSHLSTLLCLIAFPEIIQYLPEGHKAIGKLGSCWWHWSRRDISKLWRNSN